VSDESFGWGRNRCGSAARCWLIAGCRATGTKVADGFPYSGEIGASFWGPASGAPAAFVNASRRARSALGVTVYIIPAAHASLLRVVPKHCAGEEASALQRELARVSSPTRARILALQRQYLAWQRYEALNPEGIVLGDVNAKAQGIDGTATIVDIEHAGMLDGNAGYPGAELATTSSTSPQTRAGAGGRHTCPDKCCRSWAHPTRGPD
jgi:hypothetical protein